MEGMAYDWTPKDVAKSPSNGLEDVIRFLYSHFQIFTSLPVSKRSCMVIIDNFAYSQTLEGNVLHYYYLSNMIAMSFCKKWTKHCVMLSSFDCRLTLLM